MKVNQLKLEFLNQKHSRGYSELPKQIGRWVKQTPNRDVTIDIQISYLQNCPQFTKLSRNFLNILLMSYIKFQNISSKLKIRNDIHSIIKRKKAYNSTVFGHHCMFICSDMRWSCCKGPEIGGEGCTPLCDLCDSEWGSGAPCVLIR